MQGRSTPAFFQIHPRHLYRCKEDHPNVCGLITCLGVKSSPAWEDVTIVRVFQRFDTDTLAACDVSRPHKVPQVSFRRRTPTSQAAAPAQVTKDVGKPIKRTPCKLTRTLKATGVSRSTLNLGLLAALAFDVRLEARLPALQSDHVQF